AIDGIPRRKRGETSAPRRGPPDLRLPRSAHTLLPLWHSERTSAKSSGVTRRSEPSSGMVGHAASRPRGPGAASSAARTPNASSCPGPLGAAGGKETMKIQPLHDRILVKRIEEETKTKGGIIIPDTAKEKPQEGKVIAVGKGRVLDDGKLQDLAVRKG